MHVQSQVFLLIQQKNRHDHMAKTEYIFRGISFVSIIHGRSVKAGAVWLRMSCYGVRSVMGWAKRRYIQPGRKQTGNKLCATM